MTQTTRPRWSAHIMATYLRQRTGLTEQQLDWEISQWLGVTEPGVEILVRDDHTEIQTERYRLKMLPGGQVVNFQLRPGQRRPRLVIQTQQPQRPQKKSAPRHHEARRTRQPQSNQSQIVEQIQAEARPQPRVFVRRRKTMEPH